VRELLIDPLCVAALNTAADQASGQVFLRVLQDALFSGRGSADLMLPRADLSALLPTPAGRWLQAQGADVRTFQRIGSIARVGNRYSNSNSGGSSGWQLDGEDFDTVVLACTAAEAARLVQPVAPSWAANAAAITYEPIVTVYLRCAGARLLCPMTALVAGPEAPAQYAFDHGALGATPGLFAFVVSGARAWVDRGLQATGEAVLRQAQHAFVGGSRSVPSVLRVMAEKRATFCCTPALQRPPMEIAPGLLAAGDYVAGPYPATLEGAVRSGEAAVRGLERWS
ncbi:MAG: FAD-dependent oxidoreductase, partial [Rubrivivax sp.]|nr:FAD-dependent oxidoreductase [Rubrivivax sp.]